MKYDWLASLILRLQPTSDQFKQLMFFARKGLIAPLENPILSACRVDLEKAASDSTYCQGLADQLLSLVDESMKTIQVESGPVQGTEFTKAQATMTNLKAALTYETKDGQTLLESLQKHAPNKLHEIQRRAGDYLGLKSKIMPSGPSAYARLFPRPPDLTQDKTVPPKNPGFSA